MFRIEFDERLLLLTITLEGLWTMETFSRYSAELRSTIQQIRLRHDSFQMLSRSTSFPIQSNEVTLGFSEHAEELRKLCLGRLAIVVGGILNKLQAAHALPDPNIRMFLDEKEALQWLFGEGALPPAGQS